MLGKKSEALIMILGWPTVESCAYSGFITNSISPASIGQSRWKFVKEITIRAQYGKGGQCKPRRNAFHHLAQWSSWHLVTHNFLGRNLKINRLRTICRSVTHMANVPSLWKVDYYLNFGSKYGSFWVYCKPHIWHSIQVILGRKLFKMFGIGKQSWPFYYVAR